MNLVSILAADGSAAGESMLNALVFPIAMVVMILWMVVIYRKQSKEQKEHQMLAATAEVGDSILTSSGFYGVITGVVKEKDENGQTVENSGVVIVEFGGNKNCRIPMKREYILEVEKANK